MKVCFKCGVEKPLSDYYKHKQMKDDCVKLITSNGTQSTARELTPHDISGYTNT